jgi:hypothetical protein
MKKQIVKVAAILLFGAAAISSCSVENNRGRRANGRHHDRGHDRHYDNNGHYYNNYK